MTKILAPLVVRYLDNVNHVSLYTEFGFHSDVLEKSGLRSDIWADPGFVFDFESIPNILRGPIGENKRGGAAHDIVCRKGVCPGITKSIAADVYMEIMTYCDSINLKLFLEAHPSASQAHILWKRKWEWERRWAKSTVVRYCPSSVYWKKYELTATAEEIYGIKGDPYVCS